MTNYSRLDSDYAKEMIQRQIDIYYESLDLCNTTRNLGTLLSRHELVVQKLADLRGEGMPGNPAALNGDDFKETENKLKESRYLFIAECILRDREYILSRGKPKHKCNESMAEFVASALAPYEDVIGKEDIARVYEYLRSEGHIE